MNIVLLIVVTLLADPNAPAPATQPANASSPSPSSPVPTNRSPSIRSPSAVLDGQRFADFYARNLRGSLFTGFLTLSGFLLSAKTFIVVKMKESLYEQDFYTRRLEMHRKQRPGL